MWKYLPYFVTERVIETISDNFLVRTILSHWFSNGQSSKTYYFIFITVFGKKSKISKTIKHSLNLVVKTNVTAEKYVIFKVIVKTIKKR